MILLSISGIYPYTQVFEEAYFNFIYQFYLIFVFFINFSF